MSRKPIDSGALRKSANEIRTKIQYPVEYEYPPMHNMEGHVSQNRNPCKDCTWPKVYRDTLGCKTAQLRNQLYDLECELWPMWFKPSQIKYICPFATF